LDGKKSESYKGFKRMKTIQFRMNGHIPILIVKIGKKKYKFGIDSGAEANVLDYGTYQKLKPHQYKDLIESTIQSVGDKKVNVVSGNIKSIVTGKVQYDNLRFIFTDMDRFNDAYGVQLDGLLGYPFLKERLHSIDFQNKELVIWE